MPPSGPVVAFVRQSGAAPASVWLANAGGGRARLLGPGGAPLVSPNGALVAAGQAIGGRQILLYDATGGSRVTVTMPRATVDDPIAWSPDSRYLGVQMVSTATRGLGHAGLAVIDTTTDRFTVVARGTVAGASFAGDDSVVYGLTRSTNPLGAVNLHRSSQTGIGSSQLTHDGRSLNPVWTTKGILFDRERMRGRDAAPAYQVWLLRGAHARRLTQMRIPPLQDGLVPLDASADGNRILAEFEGEDTSYAWTIQLRPLRVSQVRVGRRQAQGGAISRAGDRLLVFTGALERPADHGTILSLPFAGRGAVHTIGRGALPSWDL
ncbi:MAG: TolB family protein [Solirubrobacteraceae bacterium]